MIRRGKLDELTGMLTKLDRDSGDGRILRITGLAGSGKRATLAQALRNLFPDDGGSPLIVPFSTDAEDPMEPFTRAPGPFITSVSEYLDDEESHWWDQEGFPFLDSCRKGRIWESSRDQGPVDLIQAFALYLKAHLQRRKRLGRPAYLVVDGFRPDSEVIPWLRSLLGEFLKQESFRLIVICDTDDTDMPMPLSAEFSDVFFDRPGEAEWLSLIQDSTIGPAPSEVELDTLLEKCGSSLYRLFHGLLARERGFDPYTDPGEALVASLDRGTRTVLFLCHAASGLANRRLICGRLGDEEDSQTAEGARYDGLLDFGLIREDSDGRVRAIPDGPANGFHRDLEGLREAERFGEYLYQRYAGGDSIDLYRLFRYLEAWGPTHRVWRFWAGCWRDFWTIADFVLWGSF